MDKATGEYIEALYLICMYSSGACVKVNPRGVKQVWKKLSYKTVRYSALKTHINILGKGVGGILGCAFCWGLETDPGKVLFTEPKAL